MALVYFLLAELMLDKARQSDDKLICFCNVTTSLALFGLCVLELLKP